MKQSALLYGDSIFWGVNAKTGKRHKLEDRVKSIVENELGHEWEVTVEGLRGRTMFGENGAFKQRNGREQFGPIVASHLPLDVIAIMLGTNDANASTQHTGREVADALDDYMTELKSWCDFMKFPMPKLLVVAPPDINSDDLDAFAEFFDGAAARVTDISNALVERANSRGWESVDARTVCVSSDQDGIHLSPEETRKLGRAIGEKLSAMLAEG